jgi:hypothetical protein
VRPPAYLWWAATPNERGDVDITAGEAVEAQLDSFIAGRDKQRRETEGERLERELWAESTERYNAARQQHLALEWLEYHQRRQRAHRHTFALLDAMHEREIQRYSQMLGLNGRESNGKDAA